MKKSTLKIHVVLALCLCISSNLFAQTPVQKKAIADSYDQELLADLAIKYSRTFKEDFEAAKAYAAANNIPVYIHKENGGISVLHKVLEDGTLLYTSTTNQGAARTIKTNKLYPGPSPLDLEIEGDGIVMGIWDGGLVLSTHEMLEGRVVQIDDAITLSEHATHVSGTMISSGVQQSSAKGMAPKATLLASDFGNAFSEMIDQAAAGLILSNHSYGTNINAVPVQHLGAYTNQSRTLDQLLFNTPYYTTVWSAGNDRNDGFNPGDNGYDLLTDTANSKNNIVVAAVNQVNNYTGPESVVMSNFSSWGPTDDGRIKPDISAKGVDTYSSISSANDAYGFLSGTSMAAPSVTGTLALLQELYSDIHGDFMKSATVRALIIQTALEAGLEPGPDFRFGWGLLNAEAAAQALLDEGFESLINERTLSNSDTYTKTVTSNGVDPLVVTIAWTDPPAITTTIEDDPNPRLINDLNLELEDAGGILHYPWKFVPGFTSSPPFKGVNNIDNVEKVEIDVPAGDYIIRVSHVGTLLNGSQDYSLIATGILESDFTYTPDNISKEICSDQVAQYEFNYESSDTYTGPTTLTASGLPAGAVATFTPSVITADEDFILEISGLGAVSGGNYPFTVIATGPSFVKETDLELEVLSAIPLNNAVLEYPNNGDTNVYIYPTLTWDGDVNATEYFVEVSSASDFSTIVFESTTTETNIAASGLVDNTQYYWRVKPASECLEGSYTNASFTTENLSCSSIVSAQDTPLAITLVPNEIQSVVTIPPSENVLIGDINVTVLMNHSYLADLTISLISPEGTEVILMNGACGEEQNINVIFDDSGIEFECADATPSISGVMRGQNLMSPFINENSEGDWTLKIVDSYDGDGGVLANFAIEFCETAGPLSIADNTLEGFELFPNPAKDYFEFSLQNQFSNVRLGVYDINGRALISKSFNSQERKIVDTTSLSAGIYLVEINSGNQKGVKKLIIK
ncbi:S8 family serine peptidase [Psychroserpens ponticola]|uniref:S8 family serine peptidase n=1 Tax=Psychroserpens ponticola TaxID=2932268 RepID=A0ABY7S3B5_9FLAO|nr:S8 family serine peptidase [Psychroserpens ponticola]WCO03381.1 S8 family serine peptidase [Psychroserpens ponticola]